jgi:hypothetical protein
MKVLPVETDTVHADGRTDTWQLLLGFRNIVTALKDNYVRVISVSLYELLNNIYHLETVRHKET